jgi:hypothetical protein
MAGYKSVFVSALTEVTTTQKDDLGDIRWVGNKVYKYVKLANTTATVAVAAGDPVAYAADAGYNEHTVVSDMNDAAASPICAGTVGAVVAAVHSPATVYYCWVQIKGPVTILTDLSGTADGDMVYLHTTDKTLVKVAALADPICGYVADDTAQLVILDCPF